MTDKDGNYKIDIKDKLEKGKNYNVKIIATKDNTIVSKMKE